MKMNKQKNKEPKKELDIDIEIDIEELRKELKKPKQELEFELDIEAFKELSKQSEPEEIGIDETLTVLQQQADSGEETLTINASLYEIDQLVLKEFEKELTKQTGFKFTTKKYIGNIGYLELANEEDEKKLKWSTAIEIKNPNDILKPERGETITNKQKSKIKNIVSKLVNNNK
jgi:hypothetical protein